VAIAGVIHNGIAVDRYPFHPLRRGSSSYLAFVGRASPDKGPEVAIRVARRLGRRLKMALKVEEACERQHFQHVIQPLLASGAVEVRLNGSAADAVRLLAGADATLFPIQWPEPFGLVMVESMACGTPVVAHEAGASPEVVEHGVTGFLVPGGDEEGLCAAVRRIGTIDPRACRQHVTRHFSAEVMVAAYGRLFARLPATHRCTCHSC
jgi:glycosyltransferase involved in cell wall biosynthesis